MTLSLQVIQIINKPVFAKIVAYEYYFNFIVKWSGRHSTPAGGRGKRVSGAQWNELILT